MSRDFRTREREDGSKYRYPLGYSERYKGVQLEESRISALSLPQDKKIFFKELSDGRRVYFVDGTWIRDNLDISFTMGSHGEVDSYVPEGELWVDWNLSEKDKNALVFHESLENSLMKYLDMNYEDAHEICNDLEKRLRKSL